MNTIVIALIACLAPQGGQEKQPRQTILITLKQDPQVRSADIQLRDVCEISTSVDEFTHKLLGLELGRSPLFGYTRSITRNDIRVCLNKNVRLTDEVKVDFLGPKQVFAQTRTRTLTSIDLSRSASDLLDREILKDANPDITYKRIGRLSDHRVPVGRESLRLESRLHKGKLGENHVQVDVKVIIDGKEHKVIPAHFRLTRFYRVLAAAYTVRAGSVITEASLTWKRVEANFGVSSFLTSLDQIRGMTASRLLRRGDALTLSMLKRQPLITRNRAVELLVGSGPIRLRTRVIALEDGHLGQIIRVQRIARITRGRQRRAPAAQLFAKVVSPSRVVIDSSPHAIGASVQPLRGN